MATSMPCSSGNAAARCRAASRHTFSSRSRSAPVRSRAMPEPLTIAAAAALLQRRELSPVDLTEAAIARLERWDGTLHSMVTPTLDRARREAREAEAEIA